MEIIGYLSLVGVGVSLGLLGVGGAILVIPIMMYLFKVPVVLSTSYSLVVVSTTAATAAFRQRHRIDFKRALAFIIPSLVGVSLSRGIILPNLPSTIGGMTLEHAIILLLVALMFTASIIMLSEVKYIPDSEDDKLHLKVAVLAFILGVFLGILGAGGGFLIIPVLVVLLGFPMKEAVPTSLFITALNSTTGFLIDHQDFTQDHWASAAKFVVSALIGMTIGIELNRKFHPDYLRKAFAWLVLILASFMTWREFF
ncbi:MAG: sulfite exporter TauE/SafE family protein [Candidatus Paracaedibacteraceae bacterium]|nr:sulfite exporter TauE/SafE family protein [Candidatus Paracaedibacteraceae bacterium]